MIRVLVSRPSCFQMAAPRLLLLSVLADTTRESAVRRSGLYKNACVVCFIIPSLRLITSHLTTPHRVRGRLPFSVSRSLEIAGEVNEPTVDYTVLCSVKSVHFVVLCRLARTLKPTKLDLGSLGGSTAGRPI